VDVPARLLEGSSERLGLVEPPEGDERLDLIGDDPEVGGLANAHRSLELDGPGQIRIGLGAAVDRHDRPRYLRLTAGGRGERVSRVDWSLVAQTVAAIAAAAAAV